MNHSRKTQRRNTMELNKLHLELWAKHQQKLEELNHKLKTNKELVMHKFEEENQLLMQEIFDLDDLQNNVKDKFKEQALVMFEKTQQKKLIGGIGIRVGTNLLYEPEKALSWAKEHNLALYLDKRNFEQLAKTQPIDFVIKEEKITVTFPRKFEFAEEGDN